MFQFVILSGNITSKSFWIIFFAIAGLVSVMGRLSYHEFRLRIQNSEPRNPQNTILCNFSVYSFPVFGVGQEKICNLSSFFTIFHVGRGFPWPVKEKWGPNYWINTALDKAEQDQRLQSELSYLPAPFHIWSTKVV